MSSLSRRRVTRTLRPAALLAALTCAGRSSAQTLPRDNPTAMHPEGGPGSEPIQPISKGHYAVTMLFSLDQFPARPSDSDRAFNGLIRQRWVDDLSLVVGWHRRASVGVAVPLLLQQSGDTAVALRRFDVGDPILRHKLNLLETGKLGGLGVSLMNTLSIPVAAPASYLGANGVTVGASALSELRLMVVVLRAQMGVLVREHEASFGERLGTELPLAASIQLKPQLFGLDEKGRWLLQLHSRAALQTTPRLGAGPFSRASWGATTRADLGDIALILGAELRLNSGAGVPQVRALAGVQFTPKSFDLDSDGVPDDDDFCPTEAEDHDGDVDDDGCPETDGAPGVGVDS